jgi:signal transduction histidine kinase
MVAVSVAVILLGVPLSVLVVQVTRSSAISQLESRLETLRRVLEVSELIDSEIDESTLEAYVGGDDGSIRAHITVTLSDGRVVQAGEPISGRTVSIIGEPRGNIAIEFQVAAGDLDRRSFPALALVVLASVAALGAGSLVAYLQAKRLSAPMVYLSASAEQLGSGQLRLKAKRSGIEEIDLVAEELQRSAERMARRLAVERQFAADASHQLRTPLTALSMRLEEIEQLSDSPEVLEEARVSLEQIDRLGATIDDLLRRTSRDNTTVAGRGLELAHVVIQQQEEWEPMFLAQGRRMVTDVPTGLRVLASVGSLTQVIATLLENSLKHGAGKTTVRGRRTSGGIAIEVSDEGPGVSDEMAPKIFDRSVTTGGGTGLVLAVARDLVAADGGRLELSKRRPAVFTVFLRPAPPPA